MFPRASDAVRHEWHQRIEAEYRSAALTAHLTHWLIQAGALPDLIESGLRIVKDELAHAELSHEVYQSAGGSAAPAIARPALELRREGGATLESAILRYGVELFCLGETVAVRLFQRMREACTVEPARRALDRIVKDEVFHRDFGWTLLEWLTTGPLRNEHTALLRTALPDMLNRLYDGYGGAALGRVGRPELEQQAQRFSVDDRAWGLMPIAWYVEILEETLERDYRPRFEALGLEIPSSFAARLRSGP